MDTLAELNEYNQKILRYEWESLIFLIAEDIDFNYMFLAEALKKTKVQILWALNGEEAVKICQAGMHIDLIITDIQMPVMDGLTATQTIRKILPRIPIIAYTAYAYEGIKDRVMATGARECLIKPFDSRQLLITLRKYLFVS